MIDVGGTGVERDVRQLCQRHVRHATGGVLVADAQLAHRIELIAVSAAQSAPSARTARSPSSTVVACVPPMAACSSVVTSAGIEPVACRLGAIDAYVEIGLTEHVKDAQILDAAHLRHLCVDLARQSLEHRQVRADDLDGISALDAREAFLDVVLDVLREIEFGADELLGRAARCNSAMSLALLSPDGH